MIYEYYKAAISLIWTHVNTHTCNCAHEQQTYDDMSYHEQQNII